MRVRTGEPPAVAALGAAARRGPLPAQLGRATAARTARGVLVARDRDAPAAAALVAAVRRCPPPARLGRATAERGRHVACSSRPGPSPRRLFLFS